MNELCIATELTCQILALEQNEAEHAQKYNLGWAMDEELIINKTMVLGW